MRWPAAKASPTTLQKVLKFLADMSALLVTLVGVVWIAAYKAAGVLCRSSRSKEFAAGGAHEARADEPFVDIVGKVPPGFPNVTLPEVSFDASWGYTSFHAWEIILPGAMIIGLIGFMELFAISKVYADREDYEISANQELIALGTANIVGAFFGIFPIGGSFSRTAVSADAGARSLFCCATVGVVVILALVTLAEAFYNIPMPALASIIWMAVVNLVLNGVKDARMAWRLRKGDFVVYLVTFLMTFCLSIQEGIGPSQIAAGTPHTFFFADRAALHCAHSLRPPDSSRIAHSRC